MRRSLFLTTLVGSALVFGCGDDKPMGNTNPTTNTTPASSDPSDSDSNSSGGSNPMDTSAGSTEAPDPTTGGPSSDPTSDPMGTTAGDTCTFIGCTSGGDTDTPGECDVFAQDCPDGEKCSAYADDGGTSWNNTKCVPVMENPKQPGDVCTVEGNGVSGIDDCDKGAMCWDTDAENMGICVALCKGTAEAAFCEEPEKVCAIANEGTLNLCLDGCDPLAQDCDPSDVCIGSPSNDGFLCVLDASGEEGQQHDPCMFANSCDPGLLCLNSTAANECDPMSSGCCQPFCDLDEPDPDMTNCGGAGQICNPYFEEGTAPPGSENVGYCALPM
jgi:hypothetical protein